MVGGGTPSTDVPDYWGGETPWITSADIEGVRQINVRKHVTEKGIAASTTNKVPPKTLLVVIRVGLGKIAIAEASICFSQDLQGLIQNPNLICPEYTLYLLSYELQFLKFDGRGTTISGITKKQLMDLVFPLPPLNEQHRIVAKIEALFSELDKGIESFKTAREQLKVYRQALLKHAFSGKLTEQWRAENQDKLESAAALLRRIQAERQERYRRQLKDWEEKSPPAPLFQRGECKAALFENDPGLEKGAAFANDAALANDAVLTNDVALANAASLAQATALKKAAAPLPPFEKGGRGGICKPKPPKTLPPLTAEELAELPKLPEGWAWVRPEDICSQEPYSIGIGPFGSNLKVSDYRDNGIPLVFVKNITRSDFSLDLKFIDKDKYNELFPHSVKGLDLLITKMGDPPGDCEIYPENAPTAVLSADCLKFRLWDEFVDRKLYKFCINSNIVKRQLGLITKGVAQKKISVERFKTICLPFFSIEEQKVLVQELESRLSVVDQLDQALTTALQQAEALRQSILKKAFSGQLVPQDPDDEPANVLLGRIQAEKAAVLAQAKTLTPKTKTTKQSRA